MTKNRPPSRLFSWLSQWTRRYSSSDDSPSCDDTSSPSSYSQPPQPQPQVTSTEPINVPRPSITLSVAGTIDTCFYSTSSFHSSTNNPSCSSSPRRASAMNEIWKGNEDPLITATATNGHHAAAAATTVSLGASYPEKRLSFHHHHLHHPHHTSMSVSPCSPPASVHRPSSVFSLPPPNTTTTRTNRDDVRPPRLSYDMDVVLSPTLLSNNNNNNHHYQHHHSMTPSTTTHHKQEDVVEENPKEIKIKDSSWPRADRMIIRQELVRLALDGLFYSPVNLSDPSKERKILHIGCGDGSWCMDMAKKYKHCWVLGMDERDVLDRHKTMPSNFRFIRVQHDMLTDLKRLSEDQFDFIYGRFLIFSLPPDLYRDIVQECWRLCRPSGYVEMMELDMRIYGNPHIGPMTQELNAQVIHLMERRSLDPHFAQHLQDVFFFHELVEQMHQQHGYAYHAKHTSLPLGVWGGRIGVMFRDDLHDMIEMIHIREQQRKRRPSPRPRQRSSSSSYFTYIDHSAYTQDDDDDDDYDDDDTSDFVDDYDPWTDQRLRATLEQMDEELEMHWAFMNLHHAYAQKL